MPDPTPEQLHDLLEQLLLVEDGLGNTRTQLAELGAGAIPVLVDMIEKRPHDTKFVERAILALGDVGGPAEADFVASLLEDPEPMVKLAALTALRQIGERRHAEAVRNLLDHDSPSVRKEAVKTLAELGDEASLPSLRALAANDPEPYLREQALQAVTQVEERRNA
jgi:hypothetical protein